MANADLHNLRHSLAHLLAASVLELFPDAKLGIGPTIEHGFYYDFLLPRPLTPADLPKIQKVIRKKISQDLRFERQELSEAQAKALFVTQPFKLELIRDLVTKGTTVFDELEKTGGAPSATITAYKTGNFVDLCRGGHVASTKSLPADAFALTHTAGAYWRGSEKNPMLQRVYGVAFASKAELDAYLKLQVEIKKRDHRKLGADLELFSFDPAAPGAPFWHPKGMVVVRELEKLVREKLDAAGYQEISTPQLVRKDLWEKSGHWQHYRENMFRLTVDEQEYALKPMNCPEATLVYATHTRSYRDLPLRFAEFGRLFRNELSGALGGLLRVRQLTMDDAHVFCRPDQIETEVTALLTLVKGLHALFGFRPTFALATMPADHLGTEATWRDAEAKLAAALKRNRLAYTVKDKDGAFYGPKIDIHIQDALGRSWQLSTIQLDYQLPEKFNLSYVAKDGSAQPPVMIHRALLGSFERFIGILTEHVAGAFPLWLAPVQVAVIPVGLKHEKACQKLGKELQAAGLRVEVFTADQSVGKSIRTAEKQKLPYMLVIGDKEMRSPKLHVRERGKEKLATVAKKAFISSMLKKVNTRSRS